MSYTILGPNNRKIFKIEKFPTPHPWGAYVLNHTG